jgi:hypothetical protein
MSEPVKKPGQQPESYVGQASEYLRSMSERDVRIVYRPPATIAEIHCEGDASAEKKKARREAEALAKKFIEETNLYQLKPDMRVWGFTDGNFDYGAWNIWITVPDDFEIPAPFTKRIYHGGLFATHPADWDFDFMKWAEESEQYQWCHHQSGTAEEYFNPFNIYGLQNIDSEVGVMRVEVLFPIREIGKMTEEENEKIAELDKTIPHGKPVAIDLTTMLRTTQNDGVVIRYENGLLALRKEGFRERGMMTTQESFACPVKIELRAKTDKGFIWLDYAEYATCLKWHGNNFYTGCHFGHTGRDLYDEFSHRKCGEVPVDAFVDIELIFSKKEMMLKVNGEPRYYGSDHEYIKAFKENPDLCMSGPISLGAEHGATITVESLRGTELQ